MIFAKEKALRDQIIRTGRKLYDLRLVAARSGNLSARIDESNILITATGTSLGDLGRDDIIKVDLSKDEQNRNNQRLTSEYTMHSAIYKSLPNKIILHCHPPLVNAYFAVCTELKILTFETKLYLGEVPVVEQDTPAVTKPELVVGALKNNNLAVIKNHGAVAIAENFSDALYLIETLEEAVKTAAIARLFKKDVLDELDKGLKENFAQGHTAYLMFSREHIQAIVDLVNKDELIVKKGAELDLTTQVVIKMDGHNNVYKFNFEKGKIVRLDFSAEGGSACGGDEEAPFVISAPLEIWEAIFLGKLNPFVATTQGRMKLKGDFGKLSRWYVSFNRLFELFKQVRIK
ncbi:MAG: class II aldolase/adducin family protein [Candidatus Omnitrophica bacterium]|nr:class II aldolase/adducin family protein [Candidatus Omnitrophota bacterium]MBL7210644.1 class II aldolase/adducin family protein [Candidatus Omnitrophota bacterium]